MPLVSTQEGSINHHSSTMTAYQETYMKQFNKIEVDFSLVLIILVSLIVLQGICIWNHHVVCFKCIQLCQKRVMFSFQSHAAILNGFLCVCIYIITVS